MRRFPGSTRSLLLTIALAASAISLVSLAASGALASGRQPQDDIPTLKKKLAECRQDVAFDREAIDYAENLYTLAKRNPIVVIASGSSGPLIVTFEDVRDAMILNYVTGRITKAAARRQAPQLCPHGGEDTQDAERSHREGSGRAGRGPEPLREAGPGVEGRAERRWGRWRRRGDVDAPAGEGRRRDEHAPG